MTDSFKNDLIDVDYVGGEQPTHIKLEGIADQLRVAIQRLGRAIGDVYTQQTNTSSSGQYSLELLGSVGPNLNRVIGSAGWLNPSTFGRTLVTRTVVFAGHRGVKTDPPQVEGFSHYNRRQFELPDLPIVFTSTEGADVVTFSYSYDLGATYWSIGSPGGAYSDVSATKLATKVNDLADLDGNGKYHISKSGIITTYEPLDALEAFSVTYKFHPVPSAYDGASLSVIPDFSQTGTLCTVAVVSGSVYSVTLPTHTGKRSWPTLSAWTPPYDLLTYDSSASVQHPNLNQQLLLPVAISSNLSAGDPIPEGYIQLWDETNGTIVEGLSFTYQTPSVVRCTGATLTTGSSRYRLVVAGANMSRTVCSLAESTRWHDHSGQYMSSEGMYMGHRIHHYDLLNLVDEGTTGREGFTVSSIGPTRNPHPMSLHRYGYQYGEGLTDGSDTTGNRHNAMLGSLVISDTNRELNIGTADSYSVYFGGQTGFPRLKYSSAGSGSLQISGSNVNITTALSVGEYVSATEYVAGTTGVSAGSEGDLIRWFELDGYQLGATGVTTFDITSDVPSDFSGHSTKIVGVQVTSYGTAGALTIWHPQHGRYDNNGPSEDSSDPGEYNLDGVGNSTYLFCNGISYDSSIPAWSMTVGYGSDNDNLYLRIVIFYIP